jgi:hypothetical protein
MVVAANIGSFPNEQRILLRGILPCVIGYSAWISRFGKRTSRREISGRPKPLVLSVCAAGVYVAECGRRRVVLTENSAPGYQRLGFGTESAAA